MCHDTNSHPTVECHDESHVGRTDPRVISAFWATGLERNAADLVDQEKDESSHAYVRIIYCPSICTGKRSYYTYSYTIRIHVRVSHSVSPMISFAKEDFLNFNLNPVNLPPL